MRTLGWKLFATETRVAPTHDKQIPGNCLARVNFKHHIKGVWRQKTIWGVVPLAARTLWPRYVSLLRPQNFMHLPIHLCGFLKAICGDSDPKKCPDLWGTFSYMPDRPLGECGIGNQSMCIDGKNLAASPGNTYYAICATEIGELQ